MLVVIPFCARDKALAVRLAEWITELGGVSRHDCLLAVHKDTDSAGVIEPLTGAFARTAEFSITDDMIVEREQHAYAANLMWKRTANHIADMNEPMPWLWVEVDATPRFASWVDQFDGEYAAGKKPFMHTLVSTPNGLSNSGCGIYPARVRDYTDRLWQLTNVSWDVLLYPDFKPYTHYTKLIQDAGFMDEAREVLPTFPDAASLDFIHKEAVLFHRCKDGTLIDRLRERNSGKIASGAESAAPSVRVQLPPSPPSPPSKISGDDRDALLAEIDRLKRELNRNGAATKIKRPKRTAQEQASIEARMAKARAARKPVRQVKLQHS